MAQTYPYTTPEKSLYIAGVPFSDTSGAGQINGSQWDHCKMRLDGINNVTNVLSGSLYFEVTTRRQGYPMTSENIGTTYGPYYSPYWTSVAYTLVFKCYDSNNNLIGTVYPINQRTIYRVSGTTTSDGKMYNWITKTENGTRIRIGKTCEPWVIRYASDTIGDLYNMETIYYGNEYTRFRYVNRNNVTRRYFSNNGWQDFSIALPQNTTYLGVDIQVFSKPNSYDGEPAYQLKGTINLYVANIDPVIIDNPSKIGRKSASQNQFTRNGVILYKAANSTTWEKKYIYKKAANSTTWTKV